MSDLDGSAPSSVVKPKPVAPSKTNVIQSSKREAQNYFKSLSSSVKKLTPAVKSEPSEDSKKIVVVSLYFDTTAQKKGV